MRRFAGFVPGIALLLLGAVKVWTHTQSLQAFLSVRCGPEGFASAHHAPTLWMNALNGHCWGCPVAILGGVWILVAVASRLVPPIAIRSDAR